MHWKLKCLAFHTVARVPPIYRWMQRHVTGRYFFEVTEAEYTAHAFHLQHFRGGRALEFGAGTNLLVPLMLSNAGASEVIAIDLQRLASADRVNHVIRQLAKRLPGEWPEVMDVGADLARKYRIRYVAPGDARCTGLSAGSVDFICSTSVLEHVPESAIVAILAECHRIASPDAILSFIIDYHDHYAGSGASGSVGTFNFYRYGDALWRLFNPGMQYQNRLRHSDYRRLFADWQTVSEQVIHTTAELPPLAKRFRSYSHGDLSALNGLFVLSNKIV